jgi:hypothetical protein
MQLVERSGEVVFDDLPTFFKENSGKSIRAGALSMGIESIVSLISCWEKGSSREDKNRGPGIQVKTN